MRVSSLETRELSNMYEVKNSIQHITFHIDIQLSAQSIYLNFCQYCALFSALGVRDTKLAEKRALATSYRSHDSGYGWVVLLQNSDQHGFRLNKQHYALLLGVYVRALTNWRPRILAHRDYWAPADAQWSDDSDDASIESIECDYVVLFQLLDLSIKTCCLTLNQTEYVGGKCSPQPCEVRGWRLCEVMHLTATVH